MAADPKSPVRADHRFIKKLAASLFGGKVDIRPEECGQVSRIFRILNGSWVRVFNGSPGDVHTLKGILKMLRKEGKLTAVSDWGVGPKDV